MCGTPEWQKMMQQQHLMDQILRNMRERNEKVGYDPEKGTNWGDLETKLKIRVLKFMNFPTSLRFRCTATAEKKLADLRKYEWNIIDIHTNRSSLSRADLYGSSCIRIGVGTDPKYLGYLKLIFKLSKTKNIIIDADKEINLKDLSDIGTIRCENIQLFGKNDEALLFFLKKCSTGSSVNDITVKPDGPNKFPFRQVINSPIVYTAKNVQFYRQKMPYSMITLIQNWINYDVAIGSKFTAGEDGWDVYCAVEKEFEDIIIPEPDDDELFSFKIKMSEEKYIQVICDDRRYGYDEIICEVFNL